MRGPAPTRVKSLGDDTGALNNRGPTTDQLWKEYTGVVRLICPECKKSTSTNTALPFGLGCKATVADLTIKSLTVGKNNGETTVRTSPGATAITILDQCFYAA